MIVRVCDRAPVQWNVNLNLYFTPEICDVMHSSATRVLYAFDQTPSLRVRERGLARETSKMLYIELSQRLV